MREVEGNEGSKREGGGEWCDGEEKVGDGRESGGKGRERVENKGKGDGG